ncbi:hypothetical protein [Nonomuraea zeae]|uniref:hypothetical protein n=1 Tax=Nonomuraea zeae TaxID=1642303 RepID=UPI001478256B|nr:hypothetical protein [Nonomuraea zeae]
MIRKLEATGHISRRPARAPQAAARFTIAGELARERGAPTTLELAADASRWGA